MFRVKFFNILKYKKNYLSLSRLTFCANYTAKKCYIRSNCLLSLPHLRYSRKGDIRAESKHQSVRLLWQISMCVLTCVYVYVRQSYRCVVLVEESCMRDQWRWSSRTSFSGFYVKRIISSLVCRFSPLGSVILIARLIDRSIDRSMSADRSSLPEIKT